MILKHIEHEFRSFDIKFYLHDDQFSAYSHDGRPSSVHMITDHGGMQMIVDIDADEFHEFVKMVKKIDREIKKQMQNYTEEVA